MVGHGDQHGVDILAIAQVAEVLVDVDRLAGAVQHVERRLVAMVAIHVADGGHLNALVGDQLAGQVMPAAQVARRRSSRRPRGRWGPARRAWRIR